ncbi:MAG: hypothetical protein E7106_03710 [Prevotella sp.]|nr:hypothetical protein [Prevotella sp.]
MDKTGELNILENLERKIGTLGSSSCLMSLNMMSLSMTIDICRTARYFELLLDQWQECLPLGHARDVNFSSWGGKIWDMMKEVHRVYGLHRVVLNLYEYEAESYVNFKEEQQQVGVYEATIRPAQLVAADHIPVILICSLRELAEVLMEISEFLNSPTEEQIAASFQKWSENYKKHYQRSCANRYKRWKIQYSTRTLKKHLQERMAKETEEFKTLFVNDDEFEQVFDVEQRTIDFDGLSRFLFTHTERFGVSFIDARPMFSKELLQLFNFIELWRLIQTDMQSTKKRAEQTAVIKDEIEEKVMETVKKVEQLVVQEWSKHTNVLWKKIYRTFKAEISKAGPHEKFKEYSKKTVYCIIGHLKSKGVYNKTATNVEVTKLLEGCNNGMRKYINNGLGELDLALQKRLKDFFSEEMKQIA